MCNGDNSCYYLVLSNISLYYHNDVNDNNPSMTCDGSSCGGASVSDIAYLYCNGFRCCVYCQINAVKNIFGFGLKSFEDANISSGGVDINIYLIGYNAGYNLNIFCHEGDLCNIYCQNNGCDEIRSINCVNNSNSDSDNCIISNTFTPTLSPISLAPTNAPQSYPTKIPSVNPTNKKQITSTEYFNYNSNTTESTSIAMISQTTASSSSTEISTGYTIIIPTRNNNDNNNDNNNNNNNDKSNDVSVSNLVGIIVIVAIVCTSCVCIVCRVFAWHFDRKRKDILAQEIELRNLHLRSTSVYEYALICSCACN